MANSPIKTEKLKSVKVDTKPKASAQDVAKAADVGNSVVAYFQKHGCLPKDKNDLKSSQ